MGNCHQPVPAFLDSLSSEVKLQGAGDGRTTNIALDGINTRTQTVKPAEEMHYGKTYISSLDLHDQSGQSLSQAHGSEGEIDHMLLWRIIVKLV